MMNKEKRAEYMREYRQKNYEKERLRLNASNKKLRQSRRQFVIDSKSKPCADCGITYPYYVMDFDHRENKKFEIGSNAYSTSFAALEAEIAKCDVVCSNCHRERTYGKS
jgi:hypothetical protein